MQATRIHGSSTFCTFLSTHLYFHITTRRRSSREKAEPHVFLDMSGLHRVTGSLINYTIRCTPLAYYIMLSRNTRVLASAHESNKRIVSYHAYGVLVEFKGNKMADTTRKRIRSKHMHPSPPFRKYFISCLHQVAFVRLSKNKTCMSDGLHNSALLRRDGRFGPI
jgi:hypothetical protein